MSEQYHLAADRGPVSQLSLGLAVRLDPPVPLGELAPGERFLLESAGTEGKVVSHGSGSATVAILSEDRWSRTTWSLATLVRRLRG
ncbi:MAG: hypothetical protein AB7L66_14095 [Gemmatimonadales bacterium]